MTRTLGLVALVLLAGCGGSTAVAAPAEATNAQQIADFGISGDVVIVRHAGATCFVYRASHGGGISCLSGDFR